MATGAERSRKSYWISPEYSRAMNRNRRLRNLKRARELERAKAARARIKLKGIIRKAKEKPCTDCGVQYPYYVMDLDHVRGKKKFGLGQAKWGKSLSKVMAELEKCEAVCANCHRIRSWKRIWGPLLKRN